MVTELDFDESLLLSDSELDELLLDDIPNFQNYPMKE